MAPDGSWVASGGWDAAFPGFVYVFEATTGRVVTRLGPLSQVVNYLAVSPDGRFLAAVLGGGQGLRVWERTGSDIGGWRLVAEDRDYGGKDAYGAAFDRAGALYTVAFDGKLRRYAPGGYTSKPASAPTRGSKEPASVAVHPAGDRVAVGFNDSTAVEVYDVRTLARRFAVNNTGLDNGNLAIVAWSANGARLYAGGSFARVVNGVDTGSPVRVWDRAGQGQSKELQGPISTIMHLLPCGDGIGVVAQDPAFGVFDGKDHRRLWRDSAQTDMREKIREHFTLSPDARRVRFDLTYRAGQPVLFDIAAERLNDAPNAVEGLTAADTESLAVANWNNLPNPTLAGKPIELEPYETARSLAIAPDKQRFVLGTEWSLRAYESDGRLAWRKPSGVVWGLNIPRDGKVVVAAYDDGTIRWHRLDNGQELLKLFVHAKDRRWVLWTPKGYYTTSAGGEDLIGWHVNRGWAEAADFFPAARFRDQFYRPDIVQLVLATLDEDQAINEANNAAKRKREAEDVTKRLPPVINILSPADGTEVRSGEITVEYTVRSPSRLPITGVRAFIDDRPVGEGQKGFVPVSTGDSRLSLRVAVPPQDATLSLVAVTESGVASEAAHVRLRWVGAKVQEQKPKLYALVIGIANYGKPGLDLKFAAKDADDFAAELMKQEGKAYRQVVVNKLTDAQATQRDILLGLEWLKDNVRTRDDRAVLFFSGHGVTTPELVSYLVPQDVDPNKLIATGLNKRVILDVLRALPGRVLVFLDACHAAGGLEGAGLAGARRLDTAGLVNEFADGQNGIVSFVSSQGSEASWEDERWKNGAFTSALVEGLDGKALAAGETEILTIDLYRWLLKQVQIMTDRKQTPIMHSPPTLPPFAVAARR
jgi:WD40 repeat protein